MYIAYIDIASNVEQNLASLNIKKIWKMTHT